MRGSGGGQESTRGMTVGLVSESDRIEQGPRSRSAPVEAP